MSIAEIKKHYQRQRIYNSISEDWRSFKTLFDMYKENWENISRISFTDRLNELERLGLIEKEKKGLSIMVRLKQ